MTTTERAELTRGVSPLVAEREAWLQERRSGIGGSDAAAVLGVSPYSTAIDVYMDKMGMKRREPPAERMWWGSALEELIRRRYEERTGLPVTKPEGIIRSAQDPHLIASVDGIVNTTALPRLRGLEVKTADPRTAAQWGEPGTDEIPEAYVVQCCHYMLVTGIREWDVAVLLGLGDFRIYHLKGDDELLRAMRDKLTEWWERHIVRGEEPSIDGSEGARAWLHQRYPRELRPLLPAPAAAVEIADGLAAARAAEREAVAARELCENQMKALIADATGFEHEAFRVTWKEAKPSRKTDWKEVSTSMYVALALRVGQELADTVFAEVTAAATTETPGVRRFLFKTNEE